ncbi:hypothetical protein C8R43DRAFT_1012704 [Mycena crocata]|nr:hypothetical protein C8R43DRAFT_1012704 [Mycena crocata]
MAERGIKGVLDALQTSFHQEFLDANKTFMAARKSFTEADYSEVAEYFGIVDSFEDWDDLDAPPVLLPDHIVEEIATRALQAHVSPGGVSELRNEAATAQFLGGSFQTLVCQFGGVLRDRPEGSLPGTSLSSGGRLEGEIFCRQDRLLFVRELKFDLTAKISKALAQVLCELFAAWNLNKRNNKDINLEEVVPVRACLEDASTTYVISYDGTSFTQHHFHGLNKSASTEDHVFHILHVSTYVFGLLLEGYVRSVTLYRARSIARGKSSDKSKRGSYRPVVDPQPPLMTTAPELRASTAGWNEAVELGRKSYAYFCRAGEVKSDKRAQTGLELLNQSITAWPTPFPSLLLPATVKSKCESIMGTHLASLQEDPEPTWEPSSLETATLRLAAEARFWELSGFTPKLQKNVEAQIRSPLLGGEPFEILAFYAHRARAEPELLRDQIGNLMAPLYVDWFVAALEKTYDQGLWNV